MIAKAIKNILISENSASHKKSEVFSILSNFATPKFNIAVTIQGSDYSKQFRECFIIENGQFTDINLVNEYISSFLDSKYESYTVTGDVFYSLSSLKKAFDFAKSMNKEGYTPAVVVVGDLENEGAVEKQVNWNTLPNDVKNIQNEAPKFAMFFAFAHPQKLDVVKTKLSPVLGENKLTISTEQNIDKSINKFLAEIER